MVKMAVVKIGASQYKVTPDQEVTVDKLAGDKGQKLVLDQVLLIEDEGKITLGQPLVAGARVQAVIEEHFKGKKIRVSTFKAKSRYRKVKGFRAQLTRLKIEAIELKGKGNVNGKTGR
ncbi:MAG: 50S ribosomal protein L21 [Candidatus Shapirobacteria bacterium]